MTSSSRRIVATYDYVDEEGRLLFQVVRTEPKGFYQRRPCPEKPGEWVLGLGNMRRVLYRLPEVLRAVADGQPVFVVEGEKDTDNLAALGLCATTNPGGAEKWQDDYTRALAGAHVVILPDNDEPGRIHAQKVARAVHRVAASVKVVELPGLPPKGDVSDWLAAGGTKERLLGLVESAPLWEPPPEPEATKPEKTEPAIKAAGPDWVAELMKGVAEPGRNEACARLAGHFLGRGMPLREVETILLAWNQLNRPPLPEKEVREVIRSIARAEQEKADGRNFEIERVEKLETSPPIYRVQVFGQTVKMEADDLASFSRFKKLVMRTTNQVPAMKNPAKNWDFYLADVLASRLEVVPAPPEASQEAVWWDMVEQYLRSRASNDEAAIAEKRGVYRNESWLYVHGPTLYKHLRQRQQAIEPRELWDLLRQRGARPVNTTFKDSMGNRVAVKAWKVPIESVTLEEAQTEAEGINNESQVGVNGNYEKSCYGLSENLTSEPF